MPRSKLLLKDSSVYARLIHLRQEYPVLQSDDFVPHFGEEWQALFGLEGLGINTKRQLPVYRHFLDDHQGHRTWAVIALNFSDASHQMELTFHEVGTWSNLLVED